MPRVRYFSLVAALLVTQQLPAIEHKIAKGLTTKPAVDDGLLTHPLSATIDLQGRLFVSDADGIKRLEDSNLDGVFDTAILVTDELTGVQGLTWLDDSLYILSPPSLWRFTDSNGDAIIDSTEELATGFGVPSENRNTHGPFLHPNGRIYWTQPRARFKIPDNDTNQIIHSGESARIWFCQITGSDLDYFAGGGMDVPAELDFTDQGEIIGVCNGFYERPRGDALVHWIYRGVYPRLNQPRPLIGHALSRDFLPAAHTFRSDGLSGFLRYRSGSLNKEWTDQWFTTHLNPPRITRTHLKNSASSYEAAASKTVFALQSKASRFTDLVEDHNGDLLVIDQGTAGPVGEKNSSGAISFFGGTIHRISREGIPFQPTTYLNWDRLTVEEVANLLFAKEHWVRSKAITELAVRGAPAIPELRDILLRSGVPENVRQNAVWALTRMKFSESIDLIYDALTDPSPNVRQVACNAMSVTRTWQQVAANQPAERNIELERNRTISGALANIVRSDEPDVARSAAVALGRMAEFRSIGAILGRLGRTPDDQFLEHSLINALIEIDDYKTTHAALDSENPKVLNGVVWALHEMPSSQIEIFDILPLIEIEDKQLRESLVTIAGEHPNWDAGLANRFFEWSDDLNDHRITTLEQFVPRLVGSPPIEDFLSSLAKSDAPEKRSLALNLIHLSTLASLRPEWLKLVESTLRPDAIKEDLDNALGIAASHPSLNLRPMLETLRDSYNLAPLLHASIAEILEILEEPNSQENPPVSGPLAPSSGEEASSSRE